MNQPTHEEIALQAYQLWQDGGSIHGTDVETWLEAERQLAGRTKSAAPKPADTENVKFEAFAPATIKAPAAATIPDREAVTAELQKAEARAPQVPHHTGPAAKPAPPGKPIWSKPHGA